MAINIRPLQPSDCNFLYTWRIDPEMVVNSFKAKAPTWEEHLQHFEELFHRLDWNSYVYQEGECPKGVLITKSGTVHIMVSRHCRRQGVAISLLVRAKQTEERMIATVKQGNYISQNLFRLAGFKPTDWWLADNSTTYLWTKEAE